MRLEFTRIQAEAGLSHLRPQGELKIEKRSRRLRASQPSDVRNFKASRGIHHQVEAACCHPIGACGKRGNARFRNIPDEYQRKVKRIGTHRTAFARPRQVKAIACELEPDGVVRPKGEEESGHRLQSIVEGSET